MSLIAAYLVFGRGGGEPVTMPSVVGMSQSEAEQELESLGLEVDVEVEDVPKEKADTVVGQSEEEGATVETGATVALTVASGLVSLPVDEIIGSAYQEARATLEELGLTAHRIARTLRSPAGLDLDIQETSDRVEVGSTVTLVDVDARRRRSSLESDPQAHEDAQAQADEDEDSAAAQR